MKVLALLASLSDPASRYRILQYAPYLELLDVYLQTHYSLPAKDSSPAPWTHTLKKITGINPWRTWNVLQDVGRLPVVLRQSGFDAIWQSRMLLPYLSGSSRFISKPVVFDMDDAIWLLEGEARTGRALAAAHEVLAGNEYLAEWAQRHNPNVTLVPTTVDLAAYTPQFNEGKFTIGWIGTQPNFPYLDLAMPAISTFLEKHPDARLVVVSSVQPTNVPFDNARIVFRRWEASREVADINSFTVGIMPLTDDGWTRGKCGFKLLQYMACSKPVVASPVGVNTKLLQSGAGFAAGSDMEWTNAFETLYSDAAAQKEMGKNGRALVAREYDTANWAPVIAGRLHAQKK